MSTHSKTAGNEGACPDQAPANDGPDGKRLIARLNRLEALLRDHQAWLRSRQETLRVRLAEAGLDTDQKIGAACSALAHTPPPSLAAARPQRRARIDRTV